MLGFALAFIFGLNVASTPFAAIQQAIAPYVYSAPPVRQCLIDATGQKRGALVMNEAVNIQELAALIRGKRGSRSLRSVAQEIEGVSASTLLRVEQGKLPDLETFSRLCRWLGVPSQRFLSRTGETMQEGVSLAPAPGMTTPEVITAHLRADRALTPETADALATMVRLAYEAVSRGEFKSNKKTERDDATRVQDVG